jgi:ATP-binding cassette, subfamily C, bacterial LapB
MKELVRRLALHPLLTIEILGATFLITLLTLAQPVYVIQLLNRYVTYGFHGTLITLTIGMLIAILMQFCFRMIRTRMGMAINLEPNNILARDVLSILSHAKSEHLGQVPRPKLQEALTHVQTIQTVYDAQTINHLLDAPFSLIFIAVMYLLSPLLAGLCCLGILGALLSGWMSLIKSGKTADLLGKEMTAHRGSTFAALHAQETVRAFGGIEFLFKNWDKQLHRIEILRKKLAATREFSQTLGLSGNSVTSVAIYAVGAVLVVQGDLTVGALIGANILSGRAYQTSTRLVQILLMLKKAQTAFMDLSVLRQFPREASQGTALKSYTGQVEFKDLGFFFPNRANPVFESLNLKLTPGSVLVVYGANGTGKTTLAKLLLCLLSPRRGTIQVDGVTLSQIVPSWWRRQVIYMPQELDFLNGSFRENLLLLNPELDDTRLNQILRITDLKPFLDQAPNGLETPLVDNGRTIPMGIRRRLALARALASDGQLAVLDEPTDAMDKKGVEAVYGVMNTLAKAQKTIIVFTNDPKILKGASIILNLNAKPIPELITPDMIGKLELTP